jgi:hypothetical protein
MKPVTARRRASTRGIPRRTSERTQVSKAVDSAPGEATSGRTCVMATLQQGERHPKTSPWPAKAVALRCFRGHTVAHASVPAGQTSRTNQSFRRNSGTHRPHERHDWPGNQATCGDENRRHSDEAPPTQPSNPDSIKRSNLARTVQDIPAPANGHLQLEQGFGPRRTPKQPQRRPPAQLAREETAPCSSGRI